jgi:hypothetical protein
MHHLPALGQSIAVFCFGVEALGLRVRAVSTISCGAHVYRQHILTSAVPNDGYQELAKVFFSLMCSFVLVQWYQSFFVMDL